MATKESQSSNQYRHKQDKQTRQKRLPLSPFGSKPATNPASSETSPILRNAFRPIATLFPRFTSSRLTFFTLPPAFPTIAEPVPLPPRPAFPPLPPPEPFPPLVAAPLDPPPPRVERRPTAPKPGAFADFLEKSFSSSSISASSTLCINGEAPLAAATAAAALAATLLLAQTVRSIFAGGRTSQCRFSRGFDVRLGVSGRFVGGGGAGAAPPEKKPPPSLRQLLMKPWPSGLQGGAGASSVSPSPRDPPLSESPRCRTRGGRGGGGGGAAHDPGMDGSGGAGGGSLAIPGRGGGGGMTPHAVGGTAAAGRAGGGGMADAGLGETSKTCATYGARLSAVIFWRIAPSGTPA